jgi:hypothetical protein
MHVVPHGPPWCQLVKYLVAVANAGAKELQTLDNIEETYGAGKGS